MSLEDYLSNLGAGSAAEEGAFTVNAERAERLLREKVLAEPWHAWLSMTQGLLALGSRRLEIRPAGGRVEITADLENSVSLRELLSEERCLLGWLNLSRYGEAAWHTERSTLEVTLSGSAWKRYRTSATLFSQLRRALRFCSVDVVLDGKPLADEAFPRGRDYTLYGSVSGGLRLGKGVAKQFRLMSEDDGTERFAAVAYRSEKSWSQACWVSRGAVIKEERNTLERPGLFLVGDVEALGLTTDISGFEPVHDSAYFDFVNRLKKDVLWML